MSGPISESGCIPEPIFRLSIRSEIAFTNGSATSPTATTTEIAMQRSPADP